ncbi:hypothetical protein, partial [Achromobacter anxifer]|uniref:hypothetical protein n=1 Tax=Achromobacter anxifer TaxID=1287737 RepID=UPI0023F8EC81
EAVAYRVGTDLFLPEALPAAERYAEIRQKPLEPLYAAPQASDTVRDQALEDAAQAAYTALFPTNDRSDWTEFAESAAYSAKWAAQCIRALKSQSSALSAQPGAQKGGSDA